jgi:HTH-type transcriptional regulator/antitoxin HigA
MEEQNLSPKDLEPFIGSRSKVSEALSGKITLSLRMIRELNRGLGIPFDVLVQDGASTPDEIDWAKIPVPEMVKLGWLQMKGTSLRRDRTRLAQEFFKHAEDTPAGALFRRTVHARSGATLEREVLAAWLIEASRRSKSYSPPSTFNRDVLDTAFLRRLAQTSVHAQGPLVVRKILLNAGVILVIVPHLQRTRLDGAAFLRGDGHAVVALTLRYDRIDSFWFTLLHELAHLARHSQNTTAFLDDLDLTIGTDSLEVEADMVAREAVVPRQVWTRSDASRKRTASAVIALAAQLGVHPALVAGRLRFETKNYHLLNNLVGHGQIRHLFSEELGQGR